MRCGSKTDVTWSPRRCSRSASSRLGVPRPGRDEGLIGLAELSGARPGSRASARGDGLIDQCPRRADRLVPRAGDGRPARTPWRARRARDSPRRAPAAAASTRRCPRPTRMPRGSPPGTRDGPERRRAAPPPVAGARQPERGPRRGHVRQPAFLGQARVPRMPRRSRPATRRPGRPAPGRSAASPRRPNGSSRGFSVHRVVTRGLAGNTCACGPSASPGTMTAAHCRPLAACTVASLTESVSPTRPASRPNSSSSAAAR